MEKKTDQNLLKVTCGLVLKGFEVALLKKRRYLKIGSYVSFDPSILIRNLLYPGSKTSILVSKKEIRKITAIAKASYFVVETVERRGRYYKADLTFKAKLLHWKDAYKRKKVVKERLEIEEETFTWPCLQVRFLP